MQNKMKDVRRNLKATALALAFAGQPAFAQFQGSGDLSPVMDVLTQKVTVGARVFFALTMVVSGAISGWGIGEGMNSYWQGGKRQTGWGLFAFFVSIIGLLMAHKIASGIIGTSFP